MISRARIAGVLAVLLLAYLVMIGRLGYLQIVRHEFFKNKVENQVRKTFPLQSRRGSIYDRNGLLLATTVETYSVYVDCQVIKDKPKLTQVLSLSLKIPATPLAEKLKAERAFVLVKRNISNQEYVDLSEQKLRGVYFIQSQKRVYLRDYLASQVIGFVDQDLRGQGGVEYSFDRYLQGIPGKLVIESDALGKEIYSGNRILSEPRHGDDLELTIDEFIQYITQKELQAAYQKLHADRATAVVLSVDTGEVLALVSLPGYNPNTYWEFSNIARGNSAVQDLYEPGSVFKLFTMACALEKNLVSLNETYVNGNDFEYGGRHIRESHQLKDPLKVRTMREIIIDSLNIGAAHLAIKIGKNRFYEYIRSAGFWGKTEIELPAEGCVQINAPKNWSESDEAIIGFGHTIAATPLQVACAVNAIAHDGVYVYPKIVRAIMDQQGHVLKDYTKQIRPRRTIDPEVARQLRLMMQDCVAQGTGALAQVEGYSIAGKTGTSQKVNPNGGGYIPNEYISSFVGMIPGNRPKVLILVVIDNPRGVYYGGETAAPVFQKIAREVIRYLSIPPDM
jgi:cell division protein FtsI/penicillin-binding protein 2